MGIGGLVMPAAIRLILLITVAMAICNTLPMPRMLTLSHTSVLMIVFNAVRQALYL